MMPKARISNRAIMERKRRNAQNHYLKRTKRKRREFIKTIIDAKGKKPPDAHPHRPWMSRHTMRAIRGTAGNGDRKLRNGYWEPE